MRLFFTLFLPVLLLPFGPFAAENTFEAAKPTVLPPDYCRIYGSVYLERNPARKAGTQFSVYEEETSGFETLAVFKESNKLFADAPGLWYLAPGRNFADFVIYVEPNRNLADFSIHFTESRSFAGCRK